MKKEGFRALISLVIFILGVAITLPMATGVLLDKLPGHGEITEPDDYLDKTVKMNGSFAVQHDEETGKNYYACIIKDAAACCSQGLEFELSDDYKYPDDYPNEGEIISVVGVFDVYQEGDSEYCVLRKADLVDR